MAQIGIAEAWGAGIAHLEAERFVAAETAFRQMLVAWPDHAPIRHALCLIARRTNDTVAALQHAEAAIALAPRAAANHVMQARVLAEMGRWRDVEAAFRAAAGCGDAGAALWPDFVETLEHIGEALRRAGDLDDAEACLRRLIALAPDGAEARFRLGLVLHEREDHAGAADAFRATLRLRPDHDDASNNLGSTLMELGALAEAEACLRAACKNQPDHAGPHNNLGTVLSRSGQHDAAEACFRTALSLAPDHARARCNLATTQLLMGSFADGWANLEARWRTGEVAPRRFAQERWQGEQVGPGRVLLLHAEQGLGDTLQFCRFVPRAAERAEVVLEVPRPLQRLLAGAFPQVRVVVAGEDLPPFDVQCPLLSLPLVLGLGEADLRAPAPYLAAEPGSAAAWSGCLARLPGRRVGLVWQGNPRFASLRRRRDLPAEFLSRLQDVAGVSFVSLQKDPAGMAPALMLHDWTSDLSDMADTASLVQQLDLVIGVDTAVVHLAAALGRPTWLLNRYDTCWRWMASGEGSLWYPTVRQFRQEADRDWGRVIERICVELNDGPK